MYYSAKHDHKGSGKLSYRFLYYQVGTIGFTIRFTQTKIVNLAKRLFDQTAPGRKISVPSPVRIQSTSRRTFQTFFCINEVIHFPVFIFRHLQIVIKKIGKNWNKQL